MQRVAVITGAGGGGSGRAEAREFARAGYRVVVADISESGGTSTARTIEAEGGRAVFRRTDVGVESDAQALIDFAAKAYGRVDVLVNNASAPFRHGTPLEHWTEAIRVDVLGTMWASRAAIDVMRRTGGGAIVNVGSTSAAVHDNSFAPAYEAAKAAIMRFSTSLGWLAKEGIRVSCVVPDWIATPEVSHYWNALPEAERLPPRIPKVLTSPEEIAEAVRHLAEDEMSAGKALVWWSGREPFVLPYSGRADGG